MRRRDVIAGGFAVTALPAMAIGATGYYPNGDVEFGLPDLQLLYPRQECPQWCWAASIQTIFAIWGYDVGQEALVGFVKGRDRSGRLICSGASDEEMLFAIRQSYLDNNGRRFRGAYFHALTRDTLPTNGFWWNVIRVELENGRPLLAAYDTGPYSGHAVVVTAIRVRNIDSPRPQLISMTIRDPWPDSPNRRSLSLREVENLSFIAAVSVTPPRPRAG